MSPDDIMLITLELTMLTIRTQMLLFYIFVNYSIIEIVIITLFKITLLGFTMSGGFRPRRGVCWASPWAQGHRSQLPRCSPIGCVVSPCKLQGSTLQLSVWDFCQRLNTNTDRERTPYCYPFGKTSWVL